MHKSKQVVFMSKLNQTVDHVIKMSPGERYLSFLGCFRVIKRGWY